MKTLSFGKTGLFRAFFFLSIFLFTKQLSAFGPCDSIKFTLENYQSCCYRLHVDNSLFECYDELLLFIDAGTYSSFQANSAAGWTVDQISPTEILFKHNTGNIPVGISIPGTFCLEPGFDPVLSIAWANTCDLLGCFRDIPLKGCTIVADACILGVKYRECDQAAYSNQTPIPNFTINLIDKSGSIISSTVTDSAGEYSFCDLPPGNYIVREVSQPGWTPNIPANGQHNVTLLQSEIVTRNFGNCPGCSCDSIYTDVVPIELDSDTCSYAILINDNNAYCFDSFNLKITPGKGYLSSWTILESDWIVTQSDSHYLNFRRAQAKQLKAYKIIFKVSGNVEHELALSSFYNIGGNDIECKKVFNFECPRKKTPTNCCPTGTIQGPELVVNGSFLDPIGPIGSCFPWFTPWSQSPTGSHSVLQSIQVYAANYQWSCTEKTANSLTGKMLIVNGALGNCNIAWEEMVNVQKDVQYAFCAYVNNLVIPIFNYVDPIVELWIGTKVQTISLPESPDQWQSISALWTSTVTGSIKIQIRVIGPISVSGVDVAVDDISFRSCIKDTCICGPYDFLYGIGHGPLLPYHCNDTLSVPSSGAILPIRFFSSFSCIGPNCTQATVDWILTGPTPFIPISMNNVNATPGFTVPITNATFAYPGLYTLTIIGYCDGKPCPPCVLYFNADGHDCCKNQPDFELAIANAVTISIDNDKCKATLNIGNLPKCDSIGPIFWGDGIATQGNFTAGTMPMHNYAGNGTYFITWTATEYDYSVMPPKKCFEKVYRDSITLVCDTCQCKSFSPLFFINPNWPGFPPVATCGIPIQLPCFKAGQYLLFKGVLNCNTVNCLRDSIHWNIVQTISGQPVSFGTASITDWNPNSSGYFDIILNSVLFNAGVQYTLNITGQCGSNKCTCKVIFSFAACPCPCDDIKQDVFQGFYVSGNKLSCNRILKPKALCPDDRVSWVVTPSISPAPGTSIGNNSQVIHFPNPGIYTVCMFVTRIDPVKFDTCQEFYCRKVTVNCFPNPHLRLCETNAIKNGDFTEGRIEGHMSLSAGGKIDDWKLFPNIGDGSVFVTDSSGASDDGSVVLIGNKNNFAGIWQQIDLGVDSFINIGFEILNFRLDSNTLVFRLQKEPTLNSTGSVEVLRKSAPWPKKETNDYRRVDTSINLQHDPELKYLVICLQNQSENEYSVVGLDNIEMCTSKVPLSTISEQFGKLRIYPNPSAGNFTIEMQQAASTGMIFRIIDLTGRNVLEKQTITGNQVQNIDAGNLASGFYFLQVVSKGKVLAVEKLMKQ